MKDKAFKEITPFMDQKWGEEKSIRIRKAAERRLAELCQENASDPKPVKVHTEQDIFPCISLYEAMQQEGVPGKEAEEFLDWCWSKKAESGAKSMKKTLAFAGLYKLYPAMFRLVAKSQFGEKAGFQAKFYHTGPSRCKFDMKKCLSFDTCNRYGCPELTKCFCHVDDVNNENLHPRLIWNRTKYMGGGGDLCDFDIYLK